MPGDINWDMDEINFKDYDLPQPHLLLPDSPICPILVKLFMQVPGLTVIPPVFFEHMPMLEVLDLSNTNIVSLPTSIASLRLLREFFLRDCCALIELPTQVGMLSKLKLFDIKGTELMFIPKEMGKLKDLEVLRVSLSEYAKDYIETNSAIESVIPQNMILELKQLKELCISVPPEAEWWEEEVKKIQSELCDIENLEILRWYLPTNEVLQQFLLLERNHVPVYSNLSNLMLTVGQHAQLTSCLPRDLEKKFDEFENCLKWINAEGNMNDVSKIMEGVEALFLSRHWTIEKLSTLNVTNLKYCLLAECNEMETLAEVHEDEDVETRIKNGEKVGLELLKYLSIHQMKNLQSIWKGPIGKDSLSKLTIFALHSCPKLTSIFPLCLAQNLSCLTELTVEDCPKVMSLIRKESYSVEYCSVFPSLQRIFLLDLPELVNIFGHLYRLSKVNTLLIYNCPKIRYVSMLEFPHIKQIHGEIEWWKDLDCDTSRWENIFMPLKRNRVLVGQLFEATNSLKHFNDILSHDYDEKKSSNFTDIREQVITADTSIEKGKGIFFPPEEVTEPGDGESYSCAPSIVPERAYETDDESYSCSPSIVPERAYETDGFYSFEDVDRLSIFGQEIEDIIKSNVSSHYEASGNETEIDDFEEDKCPSPSVQGVEFEEENCRSPSDDFEEVDCLSLPGQENNERKSSNLTDTGEQVITADTSMEKGKGIFLLPEVTSHGINAGDVNKLQDAGIYTCNGLMMQIKKNLTGIKGLSEAEVDKICEAAEKILKKKEDNPEEEDEKKKKKKEVEILEEVVLMVNLHCGDCARKVASLLRRFHGVKEAMTDCNASKAVVKGTKLDPVKLSERLQKKIGRKVEIISPLSKPQEPKPEPEKKQEPEQPKEEKKDEVIPLKLLS